MTLDRTDDHTMFEAFRGSLFTAVVGDIMDTMGLRDQFLPPQIKPLRDDMIVIGRAMTVLEADCYQSVDPIDTRETNREWRKHPFGLMLEALDDLRRDEVYLCTGGSPNYALWGELMSTRAGILGAAGAVLDGYHRDTRGILDLNFDCFSYGAYAQDQSPRGKVIDYRCPVQIGAVKINDGDIVFGDIDGVCIIPRAVEQEVIRRAFEKVAGEKTVADAIRGGMSAVASWEKYGIM